MKKPNKKVNHILLRSKEKKAKRIIKKEKSKKEFRQKIKIPPILDLKDNRDSFIHFIGRMREVLLSKKPFSIDHSGMEKITKECLVILASEIERCVAIKRIKLKSKKKFFPRNKKVLSLMEKIGYWDHFNVNHKKTRKSKLDGEIHLKITSERETNQETIYNLIQFFERLIIFQPETREKFFDAMTEAAANTVEHAYNTVQKIEDIKKWWLTASVNTEANTISFIFYDQGTGIINTLEQGQKTEKYKRLLTGWLGEGLSKGGIIRKLVNTNLSSYKDERRGNGLISFKSFIEDVHSGELTIHTDTVSYSAISDRIVDYKTPIDGTMIVWRIEANNDPTECIHIRRDKA